MKWQMVELQKVTQVDWGNTSITKASYVEKGFPAFSATGCDGFLEHYEQDSKGIVLSAIGARCGKCFEAHGKWTAIKNTITIIPDHKKISSRFLFYLLNRDGFWSKRGGGQPFISVGDARKCKIPLPSPSEQRWIVEILDQADALRKKRAEADAKAARILPALFYKMFGDPATNPLRLPIKKVSEVALVQRGDFRHRPRTEPRFYGGRYPFIQINDITASDLVIRSYTQTLNDAGLKISRMFSKGTVVLSIAATIAASGILDFDSCFPDSLVGVTAKPELATQEFLLFYFRAVAPNLALQAPQLAQKNINLQILNNLDVPLPPLALQKCFSKQVQTSIAIVEKQSFAHAKVERLWGSLLHRVFSGKLTTKAPTERS